jgi:hypothetical protein
LLDDVERLESEYRACQTNRQRLVWIKATQVLTQRIVKTRAIDPASMEGTPEWKAAIAADPRSSRVLAAIHGVNRATIDRWKRAAGTNAKHGARVDLAA